MNRRQVHVIFAVTFGNILEWYQAYSYIYLTPVLARLFFNFHNSKFNLFLAVLVFGVGFLTRPVGGYLFGYWGDHFGRKSAFLGSILLMTVPTFLMGCLPTYAAWGVWAPIALILLRFLQALPESGESPGCFCFLYENSDKSNKKFMTSWGAFGNQIGAMVAIFEALVLDQFMSEEFFLSWGWRICFWSGAAIGLLGFMLRKTLDETPVFKELRSSHRLDIETFGQIIRSQWKNVLLGIGFSAVNASTFYLIAGYVPSYFNEALALSPGTNAFISLSLLGLMTLLLPLFGMLGERVSVKKLMIGSTIAIIALLPPLCFFIMTGLFVLTFVTLYLYAIPIACITALLPFLLVSLFHASVRFTGVGLAFNLADGIIGGFTPAISILLLTYLESQYSFCWFILLCALISLLSYRKIKEPALHQ